MLKIKTETMNGTQNKECPENGMHGHSSRDRGPEELVSRSNALVDSSDRCGTGECRWHEDDRDRRTPQNHAQENHTPGHHTQDSHTQESHSQANQWRQGRQPIDPHQVESQESNLTVKTTQGERYLMIDDFLPQEVFDRLRRDADLTSYHDVPSVVDERIDGTARRSLGGAFGFAEALVGESMGGGISQAMKAIKQAVAMHPEIYGAAGIDWKVLSFALWQYPTGTRLGWHNDAGGGRTGEFILYLHDRWQPSWGGELIMLDEFSPFDVHGLPVPERFGAIEKVVARSRSNLTAIVPRPNRLVMVRAGTCHYINRVDKAAGSARRRSLTGFASQPSPMRKEKDRAARFDMLL